MTDISKEAVERLGRELSQLGCLGERGDETLRAQAARIAELEAALATAREGSRWAYVSAALEDNKNDAETAREDALREAADSVKSHAEVARKKMREAYDLGADRKIVDAWSAVISHLDNEADAILDLIKEPTP